MPIVINEKQVQSITIGGKQVQSIAIGGKTVNVVDAPLQPDNDYLWIWNTSNETATVSVTNNNNDYAADLSYSTDGTTWTALDLITPDNRAGGGGTPVTKTISLNANQWVYFKGDMEPRLEPTNSITITCDKQNSVGGKIASIIDSSDIANVTAIPDYGCCSLFNGNAYLIDSRIDWGSIDTIGISGLYYMYKDCSDVISVNTPPSLAYWDTSKATGWLDNVAASGTVYKASALTIPTGTDGVPSGWTSSLMFQR